jgi:hypothetical protein
MKRLIVLGLVAATGLVGSLRAQLLLSPGQSYTHTFLGTDLQYFGSGFPGSNPRGFATFYTDPARSTPGATYTVDLFENDSSESAIRTVTGTGDVTANAVNAWQDLQGVARITVNSGDVFFNTLVVNVFRPDGEGSYEQYSSGNVPVPEPGTVTLAALGLLGMLAWKFKARRR